MTKPIPPSTRLLVKLRAEGLCQARLKGCGYFGDHVHHIKSRARQGSNDPVNLLYVCIPCHVKITDNKPGTDHLRTFRWQKEGERESDE